MTARVYIVHCIDTEGPLYESRAAKFERLRELFGIDLAPTRANQAKLENGEIDLGGNEDVIRRFLSPNHSAYLETWDQIDAMLDRVRSVDFRNRLLDSRGEGWIYNWFCLDHVGFDYNPRRRDLGYHNISDHYGALLAEEPDCRDEMHWHFHPMSTYRDAHRCATHYFRSDEIFQILSRKVIERQWFPSVFRAGFQSERPDSHWFLEQWIPFDYSNMALDDNAELDATTDFRNGRSGDWRRAPADWSVYHPSHDDYQTAGDCRRWIARSLNVLSRIASMNQAEMDKAFERAAGGAPALVGLASHDFRDLEPEVEHIRELIARSRERFPDVEFVFAPALSAFREVIDEDEASDGGLDLGLTFHAGGADDVPSIEVSTLKGTVFGPQPYLAIETRSRRFLHDNFDFSPCRRRWFYAFHGDTLPIEDVVRVGIAANDKFGNRCVRLLDLTSPASDR